MSALEIVEVSKHFGPTMAVDDVTLHVDGGEIFGLLGPNGAGKTTLIRMILDIIRPDTGRITVLGGPMTEAKKDRIGYLPEERGLYADVKLIRVIDYLASLKGMNSRETAARAERYMRHLDLWQHRDKTLRQLSRGMHQKAQFIVTVLHEPDIVIVDEPFSGLDPVNTQLIRDMLLDLRAAGKSVIMSTHQMHQVEAMCDRIALIHHGACILEGDVDAVRRKFAGHSVEIAGSGPLTDLPHVQHARQANGAWHVTLTAETTPQAYLRDLSRREDIVVDHFSVSKPSLHDIFIKLVGDQPLADSQPVRPESTSEAQMTGN